MKLRVVGLHFRIKEQVACNARAKSMENFIKPAFDYLASRVIVLAISGSIVEAGRHKMLRYCANLREI